MSARMIVEDTLRANGLPVEPLSDFEVRMAAESMDSLIDFVLRRQANASVANMISERVG